MTEQLLIAITQTSIMFRMTTAHRRWPQFYTLTQAPASLWEATGGPRLHRQTHLQTSSCIMTLTFPSRGPLSVSVEAQLLECTLKVVK